MLYSSLPRSLPQITIIVALMAFRSPALRLASRLLYKSRTLSSPPTYYTCLSYHHRGLFSISKSPPLSTTDHSQPFIPALFFSTAARRNPARPRKLTIGEKARQLQNRRLWTYALTFSGIAGFVILVLNNFQDQLVFYVTPTDAMEKYATNPSKSKFRLGGLVLEGSVNQPASSAEMEFVITDLITDILVRYQGSLPDLFREGHSVVVEGFVKPFSDEIKKESGSGRGKDVRAKARSGECYFSAAEVLAKHDEKYMPQEVAAAIEKNKKLIEEEAEAAARVEEKKVAAS